MAGPGRGQLYEAGSAYGRPVDRSIEWWGQFEAFHAFQLMDERFGREDTRYREAFAKAWALARDAFADPQHPGVCRLMDERGEVHCESKSHQWLVSYHTARALLLTADRLRKLSMPGPAPLLWGRSGPDDETVREVRVNGPRLGDLEGIHDHEAQASNGRRSAT